MLKNFVRLESIVDSKIGQLFVQNDTPLGIVKEMLFQFSAYIAQLEAQAQANAEKLEADKQVQESTVEVPQEWYVRSTIRLVPGDTCIAV